MGLFSLGDMAEITQIANKSKTLNPVKSVSNKRATSIISELDDISNRVESYFKDSSAILITDKDMLIDYVDKLIASGIAGIDTETTGLDRIHDYVVGASLYYPGGVECYIPMKHKVPIFDTWYPNQLSYADVAEQLQRIVSAKSKLVFANADFDLSMIYKDFGIDLCPVFHYDVILAWRCIQEDERDNSLKALYNKYILEGKGDPMKFSDFFSPEQFPYCNPNIAKLYAANDAKITYDLYEFQRKFIDNTIISDDYIPSIAALVHDVEFPLVEVCQKLHRTGIYLDTTIAKVIATRYHNQLDQAETALRQLVDDLLVSMPDFRTRKKSIPFMSGADFNPKSVLHMKFLLYDLLKVPTDKFGNKPTDKSVLNEIDSPITKQILHVRSLHTLISTFVDKLPTVVAKDKRVHATFKQLGANTGRFSSADPNMQNIPSHATDIRHLFRATPGYVMLSSDYSAQEPRLTAFVSQDEKMIKSFQEGKDIYASIASLSFGYPYEACLEFHPETGEYQPEGKARRSEAKSVVLGICYGRSVPSIADQLYGKDDTLSSEEKVKKAQLVYDGVLNAFTGLRRLMISSNNFAKEHGYVETVLGRRRHIPGIQLPEFEFYPTDNYVNPEVDPLDITTLDNTNEISPQLKTKLLADFSNLKYYGQIVAKTKELDAQHIRVVNNRKKIADASRQVVNSIIQGCLGPDVRIQTKEYGIIKIANASKLGANNLTIWDGEQWTNGVVVPSGKKQKCIIEFSNGQKIVCSPDHKFLCLNTRNHTKYLTCQEIHDCKSTVRVVTNNRYVRSSYSYISNLSQPDLAHNAHNYNISQIISTYGSFPAGMILGRLASDGSIVLRDDGGCSIIQIIAEHEIEVCDLLLKYMQAWNPQIDHNPIRPNRNQAMSYIRVHSHSLVNEISALDIKHHIDNIIFQDTELLRGFICGLFDGDGGISGKTIALTFGRQYNFTDMIEDIQKALLFMGIRSRIYMYPHRYKLVISTYDNKKYTTTVGFLNSTKLKKANNLYTKRDCHTFSSSYLMVKSVTITDEFIDMYDVCNTDRGQFVADGLITHNSAADQTKLAMLVLSHNKRWNEIGGRLLVPVHDELIAEVPIEHWEEGGQILSDCMIQAASFLPFESKCDVTTTLRWYGLEYPCKYTKPTNIDTTNEDEVKWVQYHLVEMEYILPVIKIGTESVRGDAAVGINGQITDEYNQAIDDYLTTRNISRERFIDIIEHEVLYGEVKQL